METWNCTPDVPHTGGTFNFPSNTTSQPIVYTVTYTNNDGCTAQTTYTLPNCQPASSAFTAEVVEECVNYNVEGTNNGYLSGHSDIITITGVCSNNNGEWAGMPYVNNPGSYDFGPWSVVSSSHTGTEYEIKLKYQLPYDDNEFNFTLLHPTNFYVPGGTKDITLKICKPHITVNLRTANENGASDFEQGHTSFGFEAFFSISGFETKERLSFGGIQLPNLTNKNFSFDPAVLCPCGSVVVVHEWYYPDYVITFSPNTSVSNLAVANAKDIACKYYDGSEFKTCYPALTWEQQPEECITSGYQEVETDKYIFKINVSRICD